MTLTKRLKDREEKAAKSTQDRVESAVHGIILGKIEDDKFKGGVDYYWVETHYGKIPARLGIGTWERVSFHTRGILRSLPSFVMNIFRNEQPDVEKYDIECLLVFQGRFGGEAVITKLLDSTKKDSDARDISPWSVFIRR